MNKPQSPLWTNSTSEARKTGTWRSALPEYQNIPSPCKGACPVDGEIATWLRQVTQIDHYGAWLTLMENNPFPAIAGRICHHPCQTACNRVQHDETVGICSLERFVGDKAISEGWSIPKPEVERTESIAVIGGGPAGLSAAYQLRRRGYQVTIYESREQLGGLLRYGIPAYRLDNSIVDAEVGRITDLGVKVHLGVEIMNSAALAKLKEDHDAVFLATGASRPKALPGLDYSQPYVQDSADFLAITNGGKTCELGENLLVIGGGSAAMDVARTARRLGRNVTVLTLESDENLPAQRTEVDEAREENVEFICGAMLKDVNSTKDGLILTCVRVEFQPGAAKGQFTTTEIEGSEFELRADAIIPAIGQDADLTRWQDVVPGDKGLIDTDQSWRTQTEGIFAAGDVASMARFVTEAIGQAKHAAVAIARYVSPDEAKDPPPLLPEAKFNVINTAYHSPDARHNQENLKVEVRLQSFDEVQIALSAEKAIAEAGRCFSCGTCIDCDNCYLYCPDMAISKLEGGGYVVNLDFCKGCGLCVAECPTGSIHMQEDLPS